MAKLFFKIALHTQCDWFGRHTTSVGSKALIYPIGNAKTQAAAQYFGFERRVDLTCPPENRTVTKATI